MQTIKKVIFPNGTKVELIKEDDNFYHLFLNDEFENKFYYKKDGIKDFNETAKAQEMMDEMKNM